MIERAGEGIHSPPHLQPFRHSPQRLDGGSRGDREIAIASRIVSRLYGFLYRLLDVIACIRRGRPARASVYDPVFDNL
jgi:hypothetical protein